MLQGSGMPSTSYTVPEAIDKIGKDRRLLLRRRQCLVLCKTNELHAGFGRYQLMMVVYAGSVWAADAMEMMLLSFIGPAV